VLTDLRHGATAHTDPYRARIVAGFLCEPRADAPVRAIEEGNASGGPMAKGGESQSVLFRTILRCILLAALRASAALVTWIAVRVT